MPIFKSGDAQLLTFKLPDNRSNVFVRAKIYDLSNPGSPSILSMTHLEDGLYTVNPSLAVGQYSASYEVFKDALFTNKYRIYDDSEESIRVENIQETITNEADRVIDIIDDSDGRIS